jgi:hypothetical protein
MPERKPYFDSVSTQNKLNIVKKFMRPISFEAVFNIPINEIVQGEEVPSTQRSIQKITQI